MNTQEAIFNYCLRLGDNALVLGHRYSEWCSRGPILEEDLALTNTALDLIGRAQAFLNYAGQIEAKGRSADDLAYKRAERKFLNNLIVELPNGDFAFTMARQLLFSAYEFYLYEALSKSKDPQIAAIALKGLKEVGYHLEHAADWALRLGDGTEESHNRYQSAINGLWPYTDELFEMNASDEILKEADVAPDLSHIKSKWLLKVTDLLSAANIKIPGNVYMHTGSREGIHTEHLGHMLSEMQYLQRAYPDAKW
ncbi:MAG: phenylacetate-CoA oxygenase subunit PaaC [Bacteroidia bacterium]|nr:phenylacetate-CoA oxygenase subunit PaaC [Bacteroidia bacterium]